MAGKSSQCNLWESINADPLELELLEIIRQCERALILLKAFSVDAISQQTEAIYACRRALAKAQERAQQEQGR